MMCSKLLIFCWLLDSHKEISYKSISKSLNQFRNFSVHGGHGKAENDTYELIGILPSLLKDTDIFPSNIQLVQFAQEVLDLEIPRWEKRSRNELIGLIICEVEEVNKERLGVLAEWSKNILNNKTKVKKMQNSRSNFSWNETIRELVNNSDE